MILFCVGETCFNILNFFSFIVLLFTVGYLNIQLMGSWIFIYPTTTDSIVKIYVD